MAFGIDIPQDAFLLNPSLIPFQFILCENKILNIVKKKKTQKLLSLTIFCQTP